MKEKEIFKRSGGITLIALVITIIVLLILAGVIIATLTGDNGLLSKASTAKNTVNESEIEEKLKLAYQDYYLGQHTEKGYTFQNAVDKMFGEGVATVTEANDLYKVTFTNGKKYTFNALTKQLAVLEEIWTQDGTTVTDTRTGTTYDVGDTVYYDSGVEEYEGTGDNQGKWAILGVENGNLLIMSKESVGSITLDGKEAYFNGSTLLDNACSSYKNTTYADSVRSVKVEDINKIVGYTPEAPVTHSYTMVNGYVKMDNEELSEYTYFVDINEKTLTANTPIEVISNDYSYWLADYLEYEDKAYNLLNGNYYIASKGISAQNGYVDWGLYYVSDTFFRISGFYQSGDSKGTDDSAMVRAVVSLKSNIKLIEGNDGWTLQQ